MRLIDWSTQVYNRQVVIVKCHLSDYNRRNNILQAYGEPVARNITLIAHSMGNWVLMSGLALTRYYQDAEDRRAVKQVLSIAADINIEDLRRGLKSGLWHTNTISRVTLYFSESDRALYGSTLINWSATRVGADLRLEGFSGPSTGDRFDRIDCSSTGRAAGQLGHSYHVSSHPVRQDIGEVCKGTLARLRIERTIGYHPMVQPGLYRLLDCFAD